jgi:Caspase domain
VVMHKTKVLLWYAVAVLAAASANTLLSALAQQPVSRGVTDASQPKTSGLSLGSYYALVIGNNDYRYLNKLKTAVNDADAMAQVLRQRFGFVTKELRNATRDEIITAMVEYRRTLPENSNLLIYYAGHGQNDRDADEAYWLPVDAEKDNNQNWISADDITRDVRAIHSMHVLIISDSCYSGTLTRDADASINPRELSVFLTKMIKSKSRTLMSSGGDEPVADSGGGAGHSVFAGAILQGLGQIADSQFTAAALFQTIQPRVAGRSDQVPQYSLIRNSGHDSGDFVFSRLGANALGPAHDTSADAGSGGNAASGPENRQPPPDIPRNDAAMFDQEKDAAAIKDVLQLYQDAYNQRDANILWKIWPSPPAALKQNIASSFRSAASIQMTLQMSMTRIDSDHVNATVRGQFSETFTAKNDSPRPQRGDIVFVLRKSNGIWIILDVQ